MLLDVVLTGYGLAMGLSEVDPLGPVVPWGAAVVPDLSLLLQVL